MSSSIELPQQIYNNRQHLGIARGTINLLYQCLFVVGKSVQIKERAPYPLSDAGRCLIYSADFYSAIFIKRWAAISAPSLRTALEMAWAWAATLDWSACSRALVNEPMVGVPGVCAIPMPS